MGIERIVELMKDGAATPPERGPDIVMICLGEATRAPGLALAESIRDALPETSLLCDAGAGGLRGKLRRADRSGARLVLILGEDELVSKRCQIKTLRNDEPQALVSWDRLSTELRARLEKRKE